MKRQIIKLIRDKQACLINPQSIATLDNIAKSIIEMPDITERFGDIIYYKSGNHIYQDYIEFIGRHSFLTEDGTELRYDGDDWWNRLADIPYKLTEMSEDGVYEIGY